MQVAGRAAPAARRTLAGHALGRSRRRSRGNGDVELAPAIDEARALAHPAPDARDLARAAAHHTLAAPPEQTDLLLQPALAIALRAPAEPGRASFGAAPAAHRAVLRTIEGDQLATAEHRLLEVDLHRVAQVAASRALAPSEAQQIAEDGVEEVGRAGHVGARERVRVGHEPEAIVMRALVDVRQHGVGRRDRLEALLGHLIAGVAIGMKTQRELPIGDLDIGVGGVAGNSQRLVVVARQGQPLCAFGSASANPLGALTISADGAASSAAIDRGDGTSAPA